MNSTGDEFLDYIIDILGPTYTVKARKMFGGYGLYIDSKIFAIIVVQELYFKAHTAEATAFFERFDSKPFSYERNGKIVKMSYWKVPPEVLENEDLRDQWLYVSLRER